MAKVTVDWFGDAPIKDVLEFIHKHGGKIVDFKPGDNPNLVLSFETKGRALDFLIEFSSGSGEPEDFLLSQIQIADA